MMNLSPAALQDICAQARQWLAGADPEQMQKANELLEETIERMDNEVLQKHPLAASCLVLRAETLQRLGGCDWEERALPLAAKAEALCRSFIEEDFENAVPVLLNLLRFYRGMNRSEAVAALSQLLLEECKNYHGFPHPRYFQLVSWIAEDEAL